MIALEVIELWEPEKLSSKGKDFVSQRMELIGVSVRGNIFRTG